MSSPAWSAVVPKYRDINRRAIAASVSLHRGATARGPIVGTAQGFWASLSSQGLAHKTTTDEVDALTLSQPPYNPFHLEGNNFFETPVARLQLTMRATERFWSNPIWLRPETIAQLKLVVAPMEAPVALWLPQCGDTYRPLCSLPPKVQHTILRDLPVPLFIQDTSHVVLAVDYHRILTELSGVGLNSNGFISVMTRPRYSWQHVTPQFAAAFDHAWSICAPQVALQLRIANGSRGSKREVAPTYPRKKMWVSLRCASSCHSEALRQFYRLPVEAITVATPAYGGLFYNAAQLFSDKFIVDKTEEVMERVRTLATNASKSYASVSIPLDVDGGACMAQHAAADGVILWPQVEHAKRLYDAPCVPEATIEDHHEHEASASLSPHDGAEQDDMLSMDAMMLFAEPELSEEGIADTATAASVEGDHAAAEGDWMLQRHLFAEDEQHDGIAMDDGVERVVVDLAAARDGDGPDAYPAELELIREAMECSDARLSGPLEVEEELLGHQQQDECIERDCFDVAADTTNVLPMAHPTLYNPNLNTWTPAASDLDPQRILPLKPKPFGCGGIA